MRYVLLLVVLLVILTGCYEGRGYAYEHLNKQDPGGLRTEDPDRVEVEPGNETIGGVYEHLNRNLCERQPICCGELTGEQEHYLELQARAAVEGNPALCDELPDEPLRVDCPNEQAYDLYNKETCKDEARA